MKGRDQAELQTERILSGPAFCPFSGSQGLQERPGRRWVHSRGKEVPVDLRSLDGVANFQAGNPGVGHVGCAFETTGPCSAFFICGPRRSFRAQAGTRPCGDRSRSMFPLKKRYTMKPPLDLLAVSPAVSMPFPGRSGPWAARPPTSATWPWGALRPAVLGSESYKDLACGSCDPRSRRR